MITAREDLACYIGQLVTAYANKTVSKKIANEMIADLAKNLGIDKDEAFVFDLELTLETVKAVKELKVKYGIDEQ